MKTIVATVGAAIAVVTLVAYFVLQDDPSVTIAADPAAAEREAQLRALQEQVAALQQRVADAEASMMRSAPTPSVGAAVNSAPSTDDTPSSAPAPTAPPLAADERAATANVMREKTLATLENKLADEELDAGWAGNFQAQLEQGLQSESFNGTRLSAVTCKRSLCRVTLAHDNVDMQEQFFEHMLELPVMANTQAYYQREDHPDGSTSLILYIAREGQALPLPPPDAPP